jgi:hypothetical protein
MLIYFDAKAVGEPFPRRSELLPALGRVATKERNHLNPP